MGKRVDFLVCIVIIFDFNFFIDQVGVFCFIVVNMIFVEIVIFFNIDRF